MAEATYDSLPEAFHGGGSGGGSGSRWAGGPRGDGSGRRSNSAKAAP